MNVPVIPLFNSTNPAPPAGFQNAKPHDVGSSPVDPIVFSTPNTGGVSVKTASYTVVATDCGLLLVYNSASAGTFTLPNPIPFGQFVVAMACIGTGALTINPNGKHLDTASLTLTINQNQGVLIQTDGTDYFTLKGGGSGGGAVTALGGDLGGTATSQTVIGLQGRPVISTAPTDGQVLTWVAADGKWEPQNPTGDGGAGTWEVPGGALNGTNKTFTLSAAPSPPNALLLFLNGVEQLAGTDYTLSGSTITYVNTPKSNDWHIAYYGTGGGGGGGGGTAALVIGFVIGNGTPGTNVGPMLAAPHSGSLSKCVVVTKAADATTALTFRINKNGTSVTNPTVAAATSSGTVSNFTLSSTVSASDVFSIDISSGTSTWQFTAQLE